LQTSSKHNYVLINVAQQQHQVTVMSLSSLK
jgi:hypothetical protein